MPHDTVLDAGEGRDPLAELGFGRYSGSIPFDELTFPDEPDNGDFDWAENDPDLRKRFGGKVVAVCERVVWGVGKNYQAAWEDAKRKPGCPPAVNIT